MKGKENNENKDVEKNEQIMQELSDDELEQVSGGGAFDNVPRVKEHDYTDDVKSRV